MKNCTRSRGMRATVLTGLLVLAALCITTGCETESAAEYYGDDLTVNPSTASLSVDDTAEFRASGGTGGYTWTIEDAGLGTIMAGADSDTVTYRATAAGTNYLQVTDDAGHTQRAVILQQ